MGHKNRSVRAVLGLVMAGLALGGCSLIGPRALENSRNPYNAAIQSTNDEQLLLNVVRLKYRDTPFFLEVSSVATQFKFNPSAGASGQITESASNLIGFNARLSYEENPTVTYAPLQGNEFVSRLLSPIPLGTILLLYNSGWSIERVLRVSVQRLNGVKNAPSASGPTPATAPKYKKFLAVASAMRALQTKDALRMGYERRGDNDVIVLRIDPVALDWPETRILTTALGLEKGRTQYVVLPQFLEKGRGMVGMETRSLLGVLFYLSQSVAVPEKDRQRGVVTITRTPSGGVFDWRKVTGDLLQVRSSETRPANASVTVNYRGHWFYIDDSDLKSKSTFSLLAQIFALQAGKIETVRPTLTLPLSR